MLSPADRRPPIADCPASSIRDHLCPSVAFIGCGSAALWTSNRPPFARNRPTGHPHLRQPQSIIAGTNASLTGLRGQRWPFLWRLGKTIPRQAPVTPPVPTPNPKPLDDAYCFVKLECKGNAFGVASAVPSRIGRPPRPGVASAVPSRIGRPPRPGVASAVPSRIGRRAGPARRCRIQPLQCRLTEHYPQQLRLDKVIFFLKLEWQNNDRNR